MRKLETDTTDYLINHDHNIKQSSVKLPVPDRQSQSKEISRAGSFTLLPSVYWEGDISGVR